jgi:hypothetical protein
MNAMSAASEANRLELLESRFALRVAMRLGEGCEPVSPDVAERLRFARELALARARAVHTAPVTLARSGGALLLGGGPSRWFKLAAVVPAILLVAGLVLIGEWHAGRQVSAAAEIDAAILADDLPPVAYADPGFVEFLKTPRE